jgi:hypothetical protein
MRAATLILFLIAAAIGYVALRLGSPSIDIPLDRELGGSATAGNGVHVYIEPIAVDPVRDAMQVRVSVAPIGATPDATSGIPDRDLTLVLFHDNIVEQVEVRAHQPAPTATVEVDLYDGDVSRFPFDVYHAGLHLRCLDKSSGPEAKLLPVNLTIWERALGFRLRTTEQSNASDRERQLAFEIRRSRAVAFFGLAVYAAMIVIAGGALVVGSLAFLGVRRPDPPLLGALAGIVFALPALRFTLPGAVPLGVWADVFVFLWTELAATFALALIIITWARAGPRP